MIDLSPLYIFGEVLFDHFPDGSRVLGGAPFNVAWHLQAFAAAPCFISRIGDDESGREITQRMTEWGMTTASVQLDAQHPTGRVQVTLADGEPHYEIVADSAYDFIDAQGMPVLAAPGILYHGSLALRNPYSSRALQTVKARHHGKVFVDVNLRSPWWTLKTVQSLLQAADWVKLNHEEFAALWPAPTVLETAMPDFVQAFALDGLIVTCGEKGALACDRQGQFVRVQPRQAVEVVDTVGAGDAFAAVWMLGLQRAWPMSLTLERAQAFASALVGRRGATVADIGFYHAFIRQWSL